VPNQKPERHDMCLAVAGQGREHAHQPGRLALRERDLSRHMLYDKALSGWNRKRARSGLEPIRQLHPLPTD
jgi:hypothetical protein